MMKKILEIACFDFLSAEIALSSLADRIELCQDRQNGGLTPSLEEFKYLRGKYSKPIYVMIRPSAGTFLYTDLELELMQRDLLSFKQAGADGFVFGILTPHNDIDTAHCAKLLDLAAGLPCTFHRAVDQTSDLEKSIEQLVSLGFQGVLTSGGKHTALEGAQTLAQLVHKYSEKIEIIVGGNVRSENIVELQNTTGAGSYHSSAILDYESFASGEEIKRLHMLL